MLQAKYWEHNLLDLAHAALESGTVDVEQSNSDQVILDDSYQTCKAITREHSKTFFMASSLLPPQKRQATQALYAFCRVSDDLVDRPPEGDSSGAGALEAWRKFALQDEPRAYSMDEQRKNHHVAAAWADARRNFRIPRGYVDQLIDGLALDLRPVRYQTFADLSRYCYGVACTVGLMSMHITGYLGVEAIPYAIRLGVALQLTNILRDVGEDWRNGRLYLPLEELNAFGLDASDIEAGLVSDRWRSFMRFQIERARTLYREALPGVALLHTDGRFAIGAAGELYRAILDRIEANDYDVFSRRASVGTFGKLRRLPGIWLRSRAA